MIFDLHNDFPTALDKELYKKYVKQNRKTLITAVIWTSELGDRATEKVDDITEALRRVGRMPIAVEDVGFLAKRDGYKHFDFDKYLYCSLTWNYDNAFAGGALDDGDLTECGKQIVEYIKHSRCVLDLAHLNKKSFYKVIERCERVICSHTGFNKHLRSLDKTQIGEIIARNGLIGMCAVTAFTGAHNLSEFAEEIDRFVQKYGVNNLAIGSDLYGSSDVPDDMNDYSKLDCLNYRLKEFGYTDGDIDGIFRRNAFEYFGF